jgi:hypothetical protein
LPYFKDYRLKSITASVYTKWQKEIEKKGFKYKYNSSLHGSVVTILNYAIKFYGLKDNIASKIGNFTKKNELASKVDFWTLDEYQKFINVIEELRNDSMRIIENETGSRIVEPHFHCLAEELVNFENVSFGIISLESLNIKQSVAVVDAYINLLTNNNVEEFYNKLNEGKIDYYKGAYNIKSVLLKGGACNE